MEPTETKTKRCTHCGVKPMSDFYQNRNTRDGLASWCKTCQKAAVRSPPRGKACCLSALRGRPRGMQLCQRDARQTSGRTPA